MHGASVRLWFESRYRAYRGIESGSESVYMYLADKFNVFSQTNFAPL